MAKKLTKEEFILKARQIHGWKYDYSKVEYKNARTKVIIICPEHGEFKQTPDNHLHGFGCKTCSKTYKNTEMFINDSIKAHGNKYNYRNTKYINSKTKVKIICPIHGEFEQLPSNHIRCGCPKCKGKNKTTEDFITEANKKHNFKYTYDKSIYNGAYKEVIITCKKHGDFLQIAHDHLSGHGCPLCKNSKMEECVSSILSEIGVKYEQEKTFDWLIYEKNMYLDFYLPEYNVAIECQGEQHFREVKLWGGKEMFLKRKKRDEAKKNLCEKNGIEIIYINYNDKIENIKQLLTRQIYCK